MPDVKNILVVDDDEVIRLACELTLKSDGMVVQSAENGKFGIDKVKATNYDLILLDLMMPEMQGTEFLEFIRNYDENIIVIVITGFATIESAVETLKQGAYDYLPKPFTPEELRKVVRKGLERRKLLIERKQNLNRIAAEQSRLATIIDCMSQGLIATDKDGQLILKNTVACELLKISSGCEIGQPIKGNLNCAELEQWILEIIEKKKFPKKSKTKEFVFDQENEKIYFATLAPIQEKKDEISGLVLVLTDISQERKFERMKAEFQKLVSVVAHELKAPINAIEGYLDLIIKGYLKEKPEKELEYLERSRDKSEKLRNLIHDLLSLTSIESGKLTKEMAPVDVRQILTAVVRFMENEITAQKLNLVEDIPENVPLISGDENSLTYLFTNLVSNAIKYNRPGGEVKIAIKTEKNQIIVIISDTGMGISEQDQKRIFEEFFRSKNETVQKIKGTGLGLSIAQRIAGLHNGIIRVDSKIDEGSTFFVTLPIIIK